MGYYSTFKIIECASDKMKEALIEESGNYKSGWYNYRMDDVKWYNWKDNLTAVSKKFPNILLVLEGHGEEENDDWRAYALGGKIEVIGKVWEEPPDFAKNYVPPRILTPYEEGYNSADAMIRGDKKNYTRNPYQPEHDNHDEWQNGFEERMKEEFF